MRHLRPTPAFVVAIVALVVALGGVGYAASKINGRNIKNGTVTGKKLRTNTLTGKQIKEGRLGKVPAAQRADTANAATSAGRAASAATADALAGAHIKAFRYESANAAAARDVLSLDGFKLGARCDAGAGLFLTYASPGGPATVAIGASDDPEADGANGEGEEAEYSVPDANPVEPATVLTVHHATGTMVYMRSDRTITVQFRSDEGGAGSPPCAIQGTATSAPNG